MKKLKTLEQARKEVQAEAKGAWFNGAHPSGIACPECGTEVHYQRTNMVSTASGWECEARCKGCSWQGSVPIPDSDPFPPIGPVGTLSRL